MRQRLVINRRHPRAQQITHLLMEIIRQHVGDHLKSEEAQKRNVERDLCRDIMDQLWADGAQMITEGDRIAAGLQPHNIEGLTVDELCIIEAKLTMAMLTPAPLIFVNEGLQKVDPNIAGASGKGDHVRYQED